MESNVLWWIPFGLNFILYGVCCLLILKRKTFTMISVRSPSLLISTILGNFLMSLVLIIPMISEKKYPISYFYYLFRLMMMVSIFLRNERIILCCGINTNDTTDMKQFYDKRYLYIEKFYVRILLGFFGAFFILTIVLLLLKKNFLEVFYIKGENNTVKMWIWVIWNFCEQFLLLTYLFRIYEIISPKQFVKFELYSFLIVWFLYSNFSILYYNIDHNKEEFEFVSTIVSLTVLYVCLILNGYMPVVMSFTSQAVFNYHFTFKLMNNLYLFLTNETCYQSFSNYLNNKKIENKDNNGYLYLKLYTHIMKYKLDFHLNMGIDQGFNEAVTLFNDFFGNDEISKKLDAETVRKVKAECNILNNHNYNENIFDEALKFAFNELGKLFVEFKGSREYSELYAEITLSSYIRCKMYNTGLINKF